MSYHDSFTAPQHAERLSYALEQAVEVTGIPRTRIYGAIANGELRTCVSVVKSWNTCAE